MALLDYQILKAFFNKTRKEGYAPVNFGGSRTSMSDVLSMIVSWIIAFLAAYLNWGYTAGSPMYVRALCAFVAALFGTVYVLFHLLFLTGGWSHDGHDMMVSSESSFRP